MIQSSNESRGGNGGLSLAWSRFGSPSLLFRLGDFWTTTATTTTAARHHQFLQLE
jgi:hypothetical protein